LKNVPATCKTEKDFPLFLFKYCGVHRKTGVFLLIWIKIRSLHTERTKNLSWIQIFPNDA